MEGVRSIYNTGLTIEKGNTFIDLLHRQIISQAYVENKAKSANKMFSFGLRWARNFPNYGEKSIQGDNFTLRSNKRQINSKEGSTYGYYESDQNNKALPDINKLRPIIEFLESKTGIDLTNYDAMLGNIYEHNSFINQHRDVTESIDAQYYPVIVLNLGADGELEYDTNNSTYGTYKTTGTIPLTNGSIYLFGENGDNRFTFHHRIKVGITTENPLQGIWVDGLKLTKYRITLTFRRASDLTEFIPKKPKVLI